MPTTSGPDLATIADLAVLTGVAVTDSRLKLALQTASARFRAAVRFPVHRIVDDVAVVEGDGSRVLILPAAPVAAVTSVVAAGTTLTGYRVYGDGRLVRTDGGGWPSDRIAVTYTHGFDPIPDEIRSVVLEHAAALYLSESGVQSMAVGGESVTFARPAGVTQDWADVVELFRVERGERP